MDFLYIELQVLVGLHAAGDFVAFICCRRLYLLGLKGVEYDCTSKTSSHLLCKFVAV